METWESMQARIDHLAELGAELPEFVSQPGQAWLYREIARESEMLARIAKEYVVEVERAQRTNPPRSATGIPPEWADVDITTDPVMLGYAPRWTGRLWCCCTVRRSDVL